MIENKDLYSFNEPGDSPDNGPQEPEETETAASLGLSYKTMSHMLISLFCILLVLIIGRIKSPWAGWTRARLHSAINASSQNTFGYISNTSFFKQMIAGGSRLIRLEEIRRMSAGKFPAGKFPAGKFSANVSEAPESFQNAVWPVQGNISKGYGWYEEPATMIQQFSPGVEFIAEPGSMVMAIADGEVAMVKANPSGGGEVVINHGNGWRSIYHPLAKIKVGTGQKMKSGTIIAQTPADKLELEIRHHGQPVDPFSVIRN